MFSRLTNMEDRELCTFMAASQFLVFDLQVRFTVLGLIHFTGFWWKKFMSAYACTHKPVLFQDTHGEQDQLGTCCSDCRCIRGGAAVLLSKLPNACSPPTTPVYLIPGKQGSGSLDKPCQDGVPERAGQSLRRMSCWGLRTAVGFRLQLCRHIVLFFHLLWRTPNCNKEALAYLYHTFMVLHGFDVLVFKPIHLKGIPSVSNYKTFCFF